MNVPLDILAIGRCVTEVQRPSHSIREAAEELGILPPAIINGVPHYNRADVEVIAEYLLNGPADSKGAGTK